jgi:membrane protease YdiL (CAAX protease family)
MPGANGIPEKQPRDRICVIALLVLASPFYLNDFANIYIEDWRWWLFVDYTSVKLLPLLVVLWLIRVRHLPAAELGLVRQSLPSFLAAFLLVTLAGTLMDQNAYSLIDKLPGYRSLASPVPEIESLAWNWIDLTLGLVAVGVFEELVFRGYMYAFLRRYTQSRLAIVLVSSVAFGLIHWSAGLHVVLVASAIGAMLMVAYMITKSLPAIMLAHAAVDFIDFAGVIPKALFKFF